MKLSSGGSFFNCNDQHLLKVISDRREQQTDWWSVQTVISYV